MKRLNYISIISVWLVNGVILLIALGGLYSYFTLFRLSGEGFRPESTEGMATWSQSMSVNVGRYELAKVTEYEAGSGEDGFSDFLELHVPFPEIRKMDKGEDQNGFTIVNESGIPVEPYLSREQWAPVRYKVKGKSEMIKLRWVFGILITLSLAFVFFILIVLRKFLLSLSRGVFFEPANYRRLIILSIPAFVIPLFEYVAGKYMLNFFYDHFRVLNGGVKSVMDTDLTPLVFGVIFLLMAGMVYEGSKLKEDQDLTI